MKEQQITIRVQSVVEDELSHDELTLVETAREAALRAYAPYSEFKVGAAVLLDNGEIISGNNQENAAYPSGMCAERITVYYANARYPFVPIRAIAITAFHKNAFTETISPCGACRQVLAEAERRFKKPIKVLLCGRQSIRIIERATDLLPLCFDQL